MGRIGLLHRSRSVSGEDRSLGRRRVRSLGRIGLWGGDVQFGLWTFLGRIGLWTFLGRIGLLHRSRSVSGEETGSVSGEDRSLGRRRSVRSLDVPGEDRSLDVPGEDRSSAQVQIGLWMFIGRDESRRRESLPVPGQPPRDITETGDTLLQPL